MDVTKDLSEVQTEASVITKELLETIMQQKENTENLHIKSFTVSRACEKGSNFASVVLAVKVVLQINEREATDHLVFKIPHSKGVLRDWVENLADYFAKESHTYMYVIPAMVKLQVDKGLKPTRPSFPMHYYSKLEGINGLIVLEDLRTEGYVLPDKLKGLDDAHCRLVLEELANFHALAFGLKNGNATNLKQFDGALLEAMFLSQLQDIFEQSYKASLAVVKLFTKEKRIFDAAQIMESWNMLEVLQSQVKPIEPFAVICHGDMSCNNTLFKYEVVNGSEKPVGVKLLDLQFPRYALPTTDLAYFFFTSTTRTMRKKSLKNLLAFYHVTFMECLKRLGIDFPEFSLAVLEELFKKTAKLGIVIACCSGFTMLSSPDNATDFSKTPSEITEHMNRLAQEMLAREENHNIIQERVVGSIEEGIEMGIL